VNNLRLAFDAIGFIAYLFAVGSVAAEDAVRTG
jgi:hypothetical protein